MGQISRAVWVGAFLMASCAPEAVGTDEAGPSGGADGGGGSQPGANGSVDTGNESSDESDEQGARSGQLDLLFMIDNSATMSDKQAIFRLAAADLLQQFAQPLCIDADGGSAPLPSGESVCPTGSPPEYLGFDDIHVAVISSSLGDAGGNRVCPTSDASDGYRADQVDLAHTIGSLERGRSLESNAYGFLEWSSDEAPFSTLTEQFAAMVSAVGENGCGWESQLESWYRFLVDPTPYRELIRVPCSNNPDGALNCVGPSVDDQGEALLDEVLLEQRRAFLRPRSTVAVVMVTDENDCSVQASGQNWVVLDTFDPRPMYRASSACETNPNDPCCYTCPLGRLAGPPEGCGVLDPVCDADPGNDILQDRLENFEDGRNLRCYEQERRFGVDFLYPTDRYVNALRQPELCPSRSDLDPAACDDALPNPLYVDGRQPSSVFLAGLVGVPWQDIAVSQDARGQPLPPNELRYKSASELAADGSWDVILGDLASGIGVATPPIPPQNPLMIESEFVRPGVGINEINGRDFDTSQSPGPGIPDDLQYACIFPLPEPRDCAASDDEVQICDCRDGSYDKPLCEEQPGVTPAGTLQYWAKAYPGRRLLQVLKDYGDNSVVTSICARNTSDSSRPDFGYRPAAGALVQAVGAAAQTP